MRRSGNIVSYTLDELAEMRARGETRSDLVKVDAITEEELERLIAEDGEEGPLEPGWDDVLLIQDVHGRSGRVTMTADIVEWFMMHHPSEARQAIEEVLRAHIERRARRQKTVEAASAE
jgi:hypothetical protein